MTNKCHWLGFVAAAAVVAGCGGSGGSVSAPRPSSSAKALPATASVVIKFGAQTSAAVRRSRKFVSPATSGVDILVYTHPQSTNPTAVAHVTADIGPSSTSCSADPGGTRTCTLAIPIDAGTYDFAFTLYDAAPAGGSFSSAHELGTGAVTKSIAVNADNVVSVAIDATIASLAISPGRQTFAIGSPGSFQIGVTPLDADNDTILATSADPYMNPVTISVTDTGSHMRLSLNGGAASSSVTSTALSDRITATYDGLGARGYFATVALAANAAAGASETLDSFYVSPLEMDFSNFGQTAVLTVDEPHATGAFAVMPVTCGGVASASPVQGSGETQTFTITGAQANGTCNFIASNEDGSLSGRDFVDLYTPGPVPTGVIYETPGGSLGVFSSYSIAKFSSSQPPLTTVQQDAYTNRTTLKSPSGIARDRNGFIYVSDDLTTQIDVFNPTVNDNMAPASIIAGPATGLNVPRLVRIGPNNTIYVLNTGNAAVAQADPNATITVYAAGSSGNATPLKTISLSGLSGSDKFFGLAIDPSGNMYTLGSLSTNTTAGTLYEISAASSGPAVVLRSISGASTLISDPRQVALDTNGNAYVTSNVYDGFLEFGPTQSGNATPIFASDNQQATLNQPGPIVVEANGTVITTGLSSGSCGEYAVTFPAGSATATTEQCLFASDSSYSDISL